VRAIAVSRDDTIAAGDEHGDLLVWRDGGSAPVRVPPGRGDLRALAIDPRGRWLAAALDRELVVWDVAATPPTIATRLEGTSTWVQISPDGRMVLVGLTGDVALIDLTTPAAPPTRFGSTDRASFGLDGRSLVVYEHEGIVLHAPDGTQVWRIPAPNLSTAYAFSSDGRLFATGGIDSRIHVVALDGLPSPRVMRRENQGRAVAASASGTIALGEFDGTIALFDADPASPPRVLRGHAGLVYDLAFSPDGLRLASTSVDGSVRVWELATGGSSALPVPKLDYYASIAYSPAGDAIAVVGSDRSLREWSLKADRIAYERTLPILGLALAYAPGGALAVGTDPGQILVLDARRDVTTTLEGHTAQITKVAFVDDATLISTGADRTVRRWDVAARTSVVLARHAAPIWGLSVSPARGLVASSGSDRSIRITSLDGARVGVLRGHADDVSGVAFVGPDRLASSSLDRTFRVWTLDEHLMVPADADGLARWIASRTSATLTADEQDVETPQN
jgi:WD40 repeat protein